MRDGNAPEMARWLAGGHAPARRVGDRPLVADRGEPGRDPARLERGHPRVPLGREGDGDDDDLLGAARLRGDRAAPRDRDRAARRRRREPRQPALRRGRRGDPHGQPDGGREARRTPATARSSPTASTSRACSCCSSGRSCSSWSAALAGGAPRRAPARPPRRHLPVHARGDVRGRARPDRLRRAHRHDARPPRRLRDVLELRRGRPPLRARAGGHAGGAAQARPAVRPDRPRAPLRAAPVRDRRALRPRPDAGRDVQAAQRLRARRARRRSLAVGDRRTDAAAATRTTRWPQQGGRRGDRHEGEEEAEERRQRPGRGRARLREPRPDLPDGGAAPAHARGDRRAPPAPDPGAARAPARRLPARPLGRARAGRARRERHALPRRRPRRGRGPARRLLPERAAAPAAHRRLRARRRHHGRTASTTPSSTRAARSRS